MKFKLTIINGCPIIQDGTNFLFIDTGCPVTINCTSELTFCSKIFHCTTNFCGSDVVQLSKMMNTKIDTLIGLDIISQYRVLFDYKNQIVEFIDDDISIDGRELPISTFFGCPIIDVIIDNQQYKLIFDTGAHISYLPRKMTVGRISSGLINDVNPIMGEFQTECYEIMTMFNGKEFLVKFGNLPPMYEQQVLFGGMVDGFVGYDLLNNFRIILDLKKQTIINF